jgi:hypothetical protein
MSVYLGYFLKTYLFISLLGSAIGGELQKLGDFSEKESCAVEKLCGNLKPLDHSITPLIIGNLFSNRDLIDKLGETFSSSNVDRRRGFFFASGHFEVIRRTYRESALPYAVEAFCSIKGNTTFDLGRKWALTFLIFNCSEKAMCIGANDAPEKLRMLLKEKFGNLEVAPVRPSKENLFFVSQNLGIPLKPLCSFFLGIEVQQPSKQR